MIDRLAVDDGARAGRVIADHAAERRAIRGRDIRAEREAELRQFAIQVVENDAGLHANRSATHVHFADAAQVLRAVDDETGTDGLAG